MDFRTDGPLDRTAQDGDGAAAETPHGQTPTAEEAAHFDAALKLIEQRWPTYRKSVFLTQSAPNYVDPERYCRDALDEALSADCFVDPQVRTRFFDWAMERRPRLGFAPVLATVDHAARGEDDAALSYADKALVLNVRDLYVQAISLNIQRSGAPEPDLSQTFCSQPFERLETAVGFKAHFCCASWLPAAIGDLSTASADAVWNSDAAQDIRRSIHDGSYRYCSRMYCPKFSTDGLQDKATLTDRRHREAVEKKQVVLTQRPLEVHLSHDRSCQLSCPSCRTKLQMARSDEAERMNAVAEKSLVPLMRDTRSLGVTGSGDPFASKHFRWLIKRLDAESFPDLRFNLQSNGLLFLKHWDALPLEGRVDNCLISIDATEPETYRVLRRGGELDDLLENLAFLSDLRREGRVKKVRLVFVVQALNFRQMPATSALSQKLGFDGVRFQMIRSWDTYDAAEFERHNIGSPKHPEFPELLEVLKDERLRDPRNAYTGFYAAPRELLE